MHRTVKLGDIGKVITGRTPKTSDNENYGSAYMFIGPGDLHQHFIIKNSAKSISTKGFNSIKSSTIQGFSILVGCIGWDMGNVGIVNGKCATNQQINSITNIKEEYNGYYIYYWLKTKKDFLFQIANVTRTPILNKSGFSAIEINIPEKSKQDLVANFLCSIDAKIELNNKINADLEAMAKLIYDYWFVQFDFPDENGKPYKTSGGLMVFNEELKREIPEGWEIRELGEEINIERGLSYKSAEIKGGGIPMISLNSFNLDGTYKASGIKMYSGKFTNKNLASSGDLLIAATDVTRNADIIGKAVLVPDYYADLVFSMDIAKVIPSGNLSETYLMMLFNTEHYHDYIKWYASGTIVLHLNMDGMKWYKAEIPPKELLDKFDAIYKPIAKRISETTKQNQQLAELRDWLLPMLMNGQVKVK